MSNGPAVAGVLAASVLIWVAAAWSLQRSVLFPRPPAPSVSPAAGHKDVEIVRLGRDEVEVWYLPPIGVGTGGGGDAVRAGPALIFAHGNGELIDYWLDPFERVRAWGVGVLLVEYPGYGRSGGKPSEASIVRTMSAAWDHLAGRPEVDSRRIIAWGRSLGGGAASGLVAQRRIAALVLESSFTSVGSLSRRYGLFGPLVRDPFDNLEAVKSYDGPVLVLHGERDEIIPAQHGRELAAAARDSELHLFPCGHNDCPTPWSEVREFLDRRGLLQ
jgi:pimeloyl-ACP methyl ester carboxylesterase